MTWTIACFHFKQLWRRRLQAPLCFLLFVAIGYVAMIAAAGAFKSVRIGIGSGGRIMNSPYALHTLISFIGYLGVMVTAAVMGQAIAQDYQHRINPLIFTTPIGKANYLLGRFCGSALALLAVFSGIAIGCYLGSVMPFVDRTLIGPNRIAAYLQPYLVNVIPNVLITGAIFFALGALTRKASSAYIAGVVLLVGWMIGMSLVSTLEYRTLASLLDPYGLLASAQHTEYWTTAEKNSLLVPLGGIVLLNRVIWLTVGLLAMGLALWRFRFAHPSAPYGTPTRGSSGDAQYPAATAPAIVRAIPAERPGHLSIVLRLSRLAFREIVRSVSFLVLVVAAVLSVISTARSMGSLYGTPTYPVTYLILELTEGSFVLFMLIIITVQAGELVWRDRDLRTSELLDALPVPDWTFLISKLAALVSVVALLLGLIAVCGIVIQAVSGYFHFELALYAKHLFGLKLVECVLLCVLALFVHVVVNHKATGHLIMVLYYVATILSHSFGFEHNLYRYGANPGFLYSDMNGFGHFLTAVKWFDCYWACAAVILAAIASLCWVRGTDNCRRARLALARQRLTRPVVAVLALASAGFAALGGYIYHNTNVLNRYQTRQGDAEDQVAYEKQYKTLAGVPQPRITAMSLDYDLYPEPRRLRIRGSYRLENKSAETISTVYVRLPAVATIYRLAIGQTDKPLADRRLGFHTFTLAEPIPVAGSASLELDIEYAARGFENSQGSPTIVANGTFFDPSFAGIPRLGYDPGGELEDDDERRKYGLAPRARAADVNDLAARRSSYVAVDADWLKLDTRVSTSLDQIAVAPGRLVREWTENGRRHYHYQTDPLVLPAFAIVSGRYQVRRERWGDVLIEVYYHRGHEYNIEPMIKAVKLTLDYCTAHLSPYPHQELRIVEFPRYHRFAQSLPAMIPYSEGIGFIAKVDPADEDDINYPFYVTAHEVAHQWWAHQVIGGNVQGATMLSESLSQYTALMVMKKELGAAQMRRFLRYELNRYLMGRSVEKKRELPLGRVEAQPYVHYAKGSLVFYALQDYLGEDGHRDPLPRGDLAG
ncbi:MAG: ABC transporter permease [Pseudomonadota bacterium]